MVLNSNSDVTTKISKEELEEFFILSDLTIQQAKEPSASVMKTPYQKCSRCWRHRPTVGASKAHPDLCDRCESAVSRDSGHVERSRGVREITYSLLPRDSAIASSLRSE